MLLKHFLKTRAWTEVLVKPLETEDFVVQPDVEGMTPKWHLAHSTWFFENYVLKPYVPEYQEYNPVYSVLFERFDTHIGLYSRPTVKDIFQYRQHVSEAVALFWKQLNENKALPDIMKRIELGVHLEEHHQELLLTAIKFILGKQFLRPKYIEKDAPDTGWLAEQAMGWNEIPEGLYTIGHEPEGFAFDNEKGAHKVFLPAFEIADRAITNKEYLEFIEAGAYADQNLWLEEGWDWVKRHSASAPLYWELVDGSWQYYTLEGMRHVEPDGPLMHVNYFEAEAFARWKGARLPTEEEWEVAFQVKPDWMYSPVWEWTNSAYLPYPGYLSQPLPLGEFTGKLRSGHMVLRGGSLATPEGHWRPSYRNHLLPVRQAQFSGIRLVR
ncbi:MAG: ergothioneine biosynthesis protein EgtB [Bacteroidia bacterium]